MAFAEDVGDAAPKPPLPFGSPRVTGDDWCVDAISGSFTDQVADERMLLEGWNLNPDEWQIIDGTLLVNRWQQREGSDLWLYQYKAKLRRRLTEANLPEWLQPTPAFGVKVTGRGRARRKGDLPADTWRVGVFTPDPQFGFWWDEHGTLRTIHDERCFDIRNQVMIDLRAEYGRISKVISAGDTADFAHFSKFTNTPNYVERTLQPTLRRTALDWEQQRAICPDRENEELIVLDGNHDNPRLVSWLIRKGCGVLVGIVPGDEPPEAAPLLSLQRLTGMDRWGVQYVEPFPSGLASFNDNLTTAHGPAYSSKKLGTAEAILKQANRSVLHGHTHRDEQVVVTLWTEKGPRTYYVGSPGTFCRTDLAVPSAKTNATSRGTPAVGIGTEDWQQGLNVVLYDTAADGHFEIESVRIWNGKAHEPSVAYWRGRKYTSTCDADGNPL